MMKRAPGFSAAAIATLVLGLGLNSAALSFAYALFLKPLPVHGGARTLLVTFGVVAGLVASAFTGPILAHLLYGVSPYDPVALLVGPSVLSAVALLAIWLPARRATAIDPIAALRSE
jgi:ABC-type antimicrobial peptide transport system permease subunit